MSAELTALEALAADNTTAWFRLSAISQAVLFYATPYLTARFNWIDRTVATDSVSDEEWDTLQAYVDGLLFEAKQPMNMLGMITAFAVETAPDGWLPCNGGTYEEADYPELYAALSPVFKNTDDHQLFTPLIYPGQTIIQSGETAYGTMIDFASSNINEAQTIAIENLPSHHHTIPLTATTLAVEPGEVTVTTPVPVFTQDTGDTGGDVPISTFAPYYSLYYYMFAGR
jgi:microcystin-dependent protein